MRFHSVEGRWLFLVEDVFPVLLMLEGIVHALDFHVAARAETLGEARHKAASLDIDAAILDTNLNGQDVYPAAEILRARGIPIVFATAGDGHEIPWAWRRYPVLRKPYCAAGVSDALAAALGTARMADRMPPRRQGRH